MGDVKISGLPVEKFNEAADVTEKVFGDSFMRDFSSKDDVFNYDNVRILQEDNRIISLVMITPKQMYIDSVVFDMGGIGGVSSLPESRGKGYAGMVMKDSIKRMHEVGCDISLLYPFKEAYYAKFGYRTLHFPYKVLHKKNLNLKLPENVLLRKFEEKDFDSLCKIYNEFNENRTGTIKRDLHYWKLKASGLSALNGEIYVAEMNGDVKAYVIVSEMKGDWGEKEFQYKIIEVGAYSKNIKLISPLFHFVAAKYLTGKFDRIFYDDINGVEIENGLELNHDDKKYYANLKDVKMLSIPHHESFMNKMTLLFNKRLKAAGYTLNSWQEILSISFSSKDQLNFITNIKYKNENLNIDEGCFLDLIFGNLRFYISEFDISDDFKKLLNILFPKIKPVFWDFDYL